MRATRLKANLAFFNPGGDVVGASAFVDLDFDVTFEDGTTRQVTRTGRFSLGRSDGVWQVIGLPHLLRRSRGGAGGGRRHEGGPRG